ncbi:hypothetical protein ACW23B_12270 [Streptomyces albidoflavus]
MADLTQDIQFGRFPPQRGDFLGGAIHRRGELLQHHRISENHSHDPERYLPLRRIDAGKRLNWLETHLG